MYIATKHRWLMKRGWLLVIGAVTLASWSCNGRDKDNGTAEGPTFKPAPFDPDRVAHRTILPQAIVSGKAMSGFVGYVLVIPKTADNPQCTLSSSALGASTFSITRYVPTEGIATIPLGDILFQSVVDKSSAGNIGYLAGTVSLSDSDVAEVIIEDAIEQEVDPGKIDIASLTQLEQQRDTSRVCEYFFVSRAFLTTVKSTTYSKMGGDAQAAFAVNVGGRHYVSTTNFSSKAELAIDARPLSTLVRQEIKSTAAGIVDTVARPVSVETATKVLTSENIPVAAAARLPAVVKLPSGWYAKERIKINQLSR